MVKKILLGLTVIIIISSVGGFFYFKNMMKAPPNLLKVSGETATVNITWEANDFSDRAAMLIPVQIKGISEELYMQFDLGAPFSLMYNGPLSALEQKYPKAISTNGRYLKSMRLNIAGTQFDYDSIRNIHYGDTVLWTNANEKIIIGTLGTDMLERVETLIDFKKSKVFFFKQAPDTLRNLKKEKFEFDDRRILFNVTMDGESKKFMWDTGSSAYELITSKSSFYKLALNPEESIIHNQNQLTRELKVYTSRTNKIIGFGSQTFELNSVTYVEGFPWYIEAAFYLTGMEGMIGNNLFRNQAIYIDARNRNFVLL